MADSKKNKKKENNLEKPSSEPEKASPEPEKSVPKFSKRKPNTNNIKNNEKSTEKNVENLFEKLNQLELQQALNKWYKSKDLETDIIQRDFEHLNVHINEYLESFLLFGYDLHGRRVLCYSLKSAKDADAVIEFLKKLFIRQQTTDFLSGEGNIDSDGYETNSDDKDLGDSDI